MGDVVTQNMATGIWIALILGVLLAAFGPVPRALRTLVLATFLGGFAVLIGQRAVPAPRIWLVLLPAVLGIAASGTGASLETWL